MTCWPIEQPNGADDTRVIADRPSAMDIHLARLAIWHTAWVLDQGHPASNESSMSKVISPR